MARAIKLLKELASRPVNSTSEALIWLTLGHAYDAALDRNAAIGAYQHVQAVAPRDSRMYAEAGGALALLK